MNNRQLNKRIAQLHGNQSGKQNATINIILQSQDPLLRPLQEDIAKLGRENINWNRPENMDIKLKIVLAAENIADSQVPRVATPFKSTSMGPPSTGSSTNATSTASSSPIKYPPSSPTRRPTPTAIPTLNTQQLNRVAHLVSKYGPARAQVYIQQLGNNLNEQELDRINMQSVPVSVAAMREFLPIETVPGMNRWGYPIGPRLLGKRYINGIR